MENVPLPSGVNISAGEIGGTATVTIEPFFPGYGTTIGNALRRVLLSSLPGAALTAFSVKGVQHEFSSLPHVKEDFVEISLNLKQVRLKLHGDQPVRLHLHATGERKVTAGDITVSSDVEIINPGHVIATLTDKSANLEMDLMAKPGRGYEPTEAREKEELEVGMIALDALYSPIRKVGFQIENVRVGQMTNWDKLILEIETDGSIGPQEAVALSVRYLVEHLTAIINQLEGGAAAGGVVETPAEPETAGAEPAEPAVQTPPTPEGNPPSDAADEPERPKKKAKRTE